MYKVLTWLLLAGATTVFWWFIETLLNVVAAGKLRAAGATAGTGVSSTESRPELTFAFQQETSSLGKFNVNLLKSSWLGQMLESDYYGIGQKKEFEPPKMLFKMEQFALAAAAGVVALSLAFSIRFNPGLVLVGAIFGFFLPHLQTRGQIAKRQKQVLINLPSFVDLLALTIESGLDYLNSMDRILATTFKKKAALEEEVENVLREVQLGYPRRDALRHFAKRVDVQEIRSLVGLLIQSDELGTGLVNLLRSFSHDMRNRRTGKAEEMASKAATKMLGPLMLFIFPVIFALILLPFLYSMKSGGGGGSPF